MNRPSFTHCSNRTQKKTDIMNKRNQYKISQDSQSSAILQKISFFAHILENWCPKNLEKSALILNFNILQNSSEFASGGASLFGPYSPWILLWTITHFSYSLLFFLLVFDIYCMGVRSSEEITPGIHARYLGFPERFRDQNPVCLKQHSRGNKYSL